MSKTINTKKLSEIYEEIKDDYDWLLVRGSDEWRAMKVDQLRNRSFDTSDYYFSSRAFSNKGPTGIYKYIDRKDGSKLWGVPLTLDKIVQIYLEENIGMLLTKAEVGK